MSKPLRHAIGLLVLVLISGCGITELRFEKIEGGKATVVPLMMISLYGARDGDSVTAEAFFTGGPGSTDVAEMKVKLHLGPPAEFVSGTYHADIGGKVTDGIVECTSLDYQGGQGEVPSMGGKFVWNPGYRVAIPSTPIKRR